MTRAPKPLNPFDAMLARGAGPPPPEPEPLPEPPLLAPGPKRGKPRRAQAIADKITVRLDQDTAAALRLEFGSLGNALYHLAQGLTAYRDKIETDAKNLILNQIGEHWVGPLPATPKPEVQAPIAPLLAEADWALLSGAIQRLADLETRSDVALSMDKYNGAPLLRPTPGMQRAEALEIALRRLEIALGRKPRGQAY